MVAFRKIVCLLFLRAQIFFLEIDLHSLFLVFFIFLEVKKIKAVFYKYFPTFFGARQLIFGQRIAP